MTYQIFSIVPEYDFRDAIVAHRAVARPNTYATKELALKLAAIESNAYEIEVVVVPFGASPFDRAAQVYAPVDANDQDIPF